MGPDELDDLLTSIKAKSKEESGGGELALYEGTKETDLVSESIDERILKLIGIEDVFDIDYGTYTTLIRERLAVARMINSNISSDEDELLRDEFKRIRGKVGRFKISRKKISAGSLGISGQVPISSNKFFLVSKAVIPSDTNAESVEEKTSPEILNALDELIGAIKKSNKIEEKSQEKERKQKQNKIRQKKENRLESLSKPIQRIMKKVVTPFQSILDRIIKFVSFTLLGFAFNNFLEWFSDPNNQKKIESIGRFLKDWWPTLLGAAALFFTPFGLLVKGVISLMRFAIPALVKIARRNPYIALASLGAAVVGGIAATTQSPEEDLSVPSYNEGGINVSMGGLRDSDGKITTTSGLDVTGAGSDTQLIAAAPGEIVIPKDTVQMYGSNYFMDIIRSSGKTGVPQMLDGIQLANQGGMVGGLKLPIANQGGMVGGLKLPIANQGGMVGGMVGGLKLPIANQGGMVGGLKLPGTGRVMQPKANYPSGQYGRLTRGGGYGMQSQFKFLGIPIPGTEKKEIFSDADIDRYNEQGGSRTIERMNSRRDATLYRTIPRAKTKNFVGDAFGNFGKNVESIRNYGRDQEERMRQLGIEPDGYTNLRGNPVMGPQSRVVPVGTPEVGTKMQTIVLPPTTIQANKPQTPTITGTKIPVFSITSRNTYRSSVSSVLGISDLVG